MSPNWQHPHPQHHWRGQHRMLQVTGAASLTIGMFMASLKLKASFIFILDLHMWAPSKTRICIYSGFWNIAVPMAFLAFILRSHPATNCGWLSACFSILNCSAQRTIIETVYGDILFVNNFDRTITTFYPRYAVGWICVWSYGRKPSAEVFSLTLPFKDSRNLLLWDGLGWSLYLNARARSKTAIVEIILG